MTGACTKTPSSNGSLELRGASVTAFILALREDEVESRPGRWKLYLASKEDERAHSRRDEHAPRFAGRLLQRRNPEKRRDEPVDQRSFDHGKDDGEQREV